MSFYVSCVLYLFMLLPPLLFGDLWSRCPPSYWAPEVPFLTIAGGGRSSSSEPPSWAAKASKLLPFVKGGLPFVVFGSSFAGVPPGYLVAKSSSIAWFSIWADSIISSSSIFDGRIYHFLAGLASANWGGGIGHLTFSIPSSATYYVSLMYTL